MQIVVWTPILFSIMNFLTVVMGLNMQCKALLLLDPSFIRVCFTFRLGMDYMVTWIQELYYGFFSFFFIFFSLLNKVMIHFNLLCFSLNSLSQQCSSFCRTYPETSSNKTMFFHFMIWETIFLSVKQAVGEVGLSFCWDQRTERTVLMGIMMHLERREKICLNSQQKTK